MIYTAFDFFVFRSTLFPFNYSINKILSSENFREAIFLASQDLYTELSRDEILDIETLPKKTKLSLIKYANRAKSRCTPFGLFAGIGTGKITTHENGIFLDTDNYKKHTRLDMQLIYKVYQYILKQHEVFEKLKFTPNTTLYKVGKGYKYIELQDSINEFKHVISIVDKTTELESVLKFTKNGATYQQIILYIVNLGFEKDEAENYVSELIENKILVSDLIISTSGKEPLKKLVDFLKENNIQGLLAQRIFEINNLLSQTSLKWGKEAIDNYLIIVQKLDEMVDTKKIKNIFQVDLKIDPLKANLNSKIVNQISKTLIFLNKLNNSRKNITLENFKKRFIDRYDNQLVPLLEVLDPDIGIGFPESSQKMAPNKLLENINFISYTNDNPVIQLNQTEELLLKRYNSYLSSSKESLTLELLDSDIQYLQEDWEGFTDTFCVMVDILGADIVHFLGSFGSSGANLLGRFCHIDEEILKFTHQIIESEDKKLKDDTICAEVIHLPSPSVGNVVLKPKIREYEISVLNPTEATSPFSIPVSDLGLILKGNRLVLWSYSLKKCIRPKMTSAHIYSKNTIDIYNFLGHLQREYAWNESLFFSWGRLLGDMEFLPRVLYKNVILSLARWNFGKSDPNEIPDVKDVDFKVKAHQFIKDKRLPNRVCIVQGDNKLYVDFANNADIEIFFSMIRKNNGYVEEFIFEEKESIIEGFEGVYKNELLLFFKK